MPSGSGVESLVPLQERVLCGGSGLRSRDAGTCEVCSSLLAPLDEPPGPAAIIRPQHQDKGPSPYQVCETGLRGTRLPGTPETQGIPEVAWASSQRLEAPQPEPGPGRKLWVVVVTSPLGLSSTRMGSVSPREQTHSRLSSLCLGWSRGLPGKQPSQAPREPAPHPTPPSLARSRELGCWPGEPCSSSP